VSGPDTEAITQAVAAGLATIAPVAFPWSNILSGAGAACTAATTGYLALKKREQMKVPTPKREACIWDGPQRTKRSSSRSSRLLRPSSTLTTTTRCASMR
jgi:phosphotransferase system  glucose/maltose/N-acetylglucosamine-specific IIC component